MSRAGARAWSLWSTANAVLTRATGEPTPTVVWAVGVCQIQHAVGLAEIWAGQHPLDGGHGGGGTIAVPGGGSRTYEIRSGRYVIEDYTASGGKRVAVVVPTRQVEGLVAVDRPPAGLVAAVRELLKERRAVSQVTQDHNRRWLHGSRPSEHETLAHGRVWADVERRCRDAAAAVWEHVRPRQDAEQLDLFAAAGGAS